MRGGVGVELCEGLNARADYFTIFSLPAFVNSYLIESALNLNAPLLTNEFNALIVCLDSLLVRTEICLWALRACECRKKLLHRLPQLQPLIR